MLIIVDANILISAVIYPDSFIGLILSSNNPDIELVLPQFALEETLIHKNKICKKLKIPENIFDETLDRIKEINLIYSLDILSAKNTSAAYAIASDIDPNDAVYIAFFIELNAIVWTGASNSIMHFTKRGSITLLQQQNLKEF